jgi:hypothetical protein
MSFQKPQRPVNEYSASRPGVKISIAVWRHENERDGRSVVNHSCRLNKRRYDTDTQTWYDDEYFWPEELPIVEALTRKAWEDVTLQKRDPSALAEIDTGD